MANSRQKGSTNERYAAEVLQSQGYITDKPNTAKFQRQDFFELFDVMAMHPQRKLLFVQVKTNGANGIVQFVKDVQEVVPLEYVRVQYWVRYDGEGWRIIEIDAEGRHELIDERGKSENIREYLKKNFGEILEFKNTPVDHSS